VWLDESDRNPTPQNITYLQAARQLIRFAVEGSRSLSVHYSGSFDWWNAQISTDFLDQNVAYFGMSRHSRSLILCRIVPP